MLTLASYRDLERELVRATSVAGVTPPVPGQDAADYLGGVARDAKGGMVLILDKLEEALAPARRTAGGSAGAAAVAELALRVRRGGAAHAAGAGGRRRRVRAPRTDR